VPVVLFNAKSEGDFCSSEAANLMNFGGYKKAEHNTSGCCCSLYFSGKNMSYFGLIPVPVCAYAVCVSGWKAQAMRFNGLK